MHPQPFSFEKSVRRKSGRKPMEAGEKADPFGEGVGVDDEEEDGDKDEEDGAPAPVAAPACVAEKQGETCKG